MSLKIKGWDLDYFNSGEWQVIDERLKDMEKASLPGFRSFNPGRSDVFASLRRTPMASVRAVLVGQDPYPTKAFATGLAFSIPDGIQQSEWPPTLRTLLREYSTDLRVPLPSSGDLGKWADNGVLLWNAVPSCGSGKSLSHDWPEYAPLTREILSKLSERGVVIAFLGQVARRYVDSVDLRNNHVLQTSHPSPRGSLASKTPFVGSRLFSTINDRLNDIGAAPIDWRLQ